MSDANGSERDHARPLVPRPRDRFSVVLGYAIFFVVACIVTGLGYVAWTGFTPQAPRTATERQLLVLKGVVDKNPTFPEAWADYANSLMDAGQLSKAGQAVTDGLSRCTTDTPIEVAQGRLQLLQGKPGDALKTLDKAVKDTDLVRKKLHAKALAAGVHGEVEAYGTQSVIAASLLEARIYWERSDYAHARTTLTRALAEDPSMTDVLTMRGDVYAKLGDKAKAEADYRAALQFVPSYGPALAGLKKLG